MMSEGILLSVLGGIAGFVFAYWLSVLNTQVNQPVGGQAGPDLTVDWHAAILAFVLAIVCGIGLSLVPALQATKADLTPSLKEGSALQLPGHRRFGSRNLLMVTQVAGSLMLLLITGFLVIGINKISQVQTKFDANTMYLLSIDPVRDGYTPAKAQALFEKLPDRIKRTGGVRNVALAEQSPFSIEGATTQMTVGDPQKSSPIQKEVVRETVGPGYFGALSEPLVSGREFEEFDQGGQTNAPNNTSLPIIVNESAARGFFGKGNAIGQRLKDEKQSYEVVGVVRDLNIGFGTRQSLVYLPLAARDFARPPAGGMTIMVRSDTGADGLNAIRGEIASVDPTLTIFNAQTLTEYLDSSRANMRFAVRTYGGIGLFGMILSAIGLAGITAYAVAQRRKEIGIRTAIGASKAQVLRLVLREGTTLVTVGTFLGFVGAVALAKILSAMANILVEAFRVGTNDARLLVGAPLLLASLAMLACYLPARRAAQIDPLKALREE
jgi:predicted permease